MEADKFLRTMRRMCQKKACPTCPLRHMCADKIVGGSIRFKDFTLDEIETDVQAVEWWAKKNPSPTRRDIFLKAYPKAEVDTEIHGYTGIPMVLPCKIDTSMRKKDPHKCEYGHCIDCRRDYWLEEAE